MWLPFHVARPYSRIWLPCFDRWPRYYQIAPILWRLQYEVGLLWTGNSFDSSISSGTHVIDSIPRSIWCQVISQKCTSALELVTGHAIGPIMGIGTDDFEQLAIQVRKRSFSKSQFIPWVGNCFPSTTKWAEVNLKCWKLKGLRLWFPVNASFRIIPMTILLGICPVNMASRSTELAPLETIKCLVMTCVTRYLAPVLEMAFSSRSCSPAANFTRLATSGASSMITWHFFSHLR